MARVWLTLNLFRNKSPLRLSPGMSMRRPGEVFVNQSIYDPDNETDVVVYMNKPGAQSTMLQIFFFLTLMTTVYNQPTNYLFDLRLPIPSLPKFERLDLLLPPPAAFKIEPPFVVGSALPVSPREPSTGVLSLLRL